MGRRSRVCGVVRVLMTNDGLVLVALTFVAIVSLTTGVALGIAIGRHWSDVDDELEQVGMAPVFVLRPRRDPSTHVQLREVFDQDARR